MEIIYIVGGSKRGLGGHQFSVRDLALSASSSNPASVIQIGAGTNPCFEALGARFTFLPLRFHNPATIFRAIGELRTISKRRQVCFVAFDYLSLAFVRIAIRGLKQAYILCKPGGSNWPVRTSDVPAFLLFSVENLDYFKAHQPEVAKRSFLIQGRVHRVAESGPVETEAFDEIPFKRKLLCVARFAPEKKIIFERAIALFEAHFPEDTEVCLCLLGLPSHESTVEAIRVRVAASPLKHRVFFLTEPRYYQGASRFFSLAYLLIGNGRTVMESLSLGVPSLVATVEREQPVLLTEQSQPQLSVANLSTRSIVSDDVFVASKAALKRMVSCDLKYREGIVATRALFDRVFNIEKSQSTIHQAAKAAEENATVVKLELNDWRMLLVGTFMVCHPKGHKSVVRLVRRALGRTDLEPSIKSK